MGRGVSLEQPVVFLEAKRKQVVCVDIEINSAYIHNNFKLRELERNGAGSQRSKRPSGKRVSSVYRCSWEVKTVVSSSGKPPVEHIRASLIG